jgi:hypothetical protein
LDLGLNDEEDNPRLVEALVKLRDHYEGQIDDLRKQVTELGGKQAQREARETQNVDRTFEKAFAIFPSVFGEGLGKNVSATKMNIRRAAAAFWHENGGDEDSVVRLVKRFVSEEFGGKRKPAPQRTAYVEDDDDDEDDDDEEVDEETQWERGVLHRPTQAGSREAPPGRDKAVQGIKRRMAPVQQARDSRQPRGIYLNSGRRSTER